MVKQLFLCHFTCFFSFLDWVNEFNLGGATEEVKDAKPDLTPRRNPKRNLSPKKKSPNKTPNKPKTKKKTKKIKQPPQSPEYPDSPESPPPREMRLPPILPPTPLLPPPVLPPVLPPAPLLPPPVLPVPVLSSPVPAIVHQSLSPTLAQPVTVPQVPGPISSAQQDYEDRLGLLEQRLKRMVPISSICW